MECDCLRNCESCKAKKQFEASTEAEFTFESDIIIRGGQNGIVAWTARGCGGKASAGDQDL